METVKFAAVAKKAIARKAKLAEAGKLLPDAKLRNKGISRTPAKRALLKRAKARAQEVGLPVATGYR